MISVYQSIIKKTQKALFSKDNKLFISLDDNYIFIANRYYLKRLRIKEKYTHYLYSLDKNLNVLEENIIKASWFKKFNYTSQYNYITLDKDIIKTIYSFVLNSYKKIKEYTYIDKDIKNLKNKTFILFEIKNNNIILTSFIDYYERINIDNTVIAINNDNNLSLKNVLNISFLKIILKDVLQYKQSFNLFFKYVKDYPYYPLFLENMDKSIFYLFMPCRIDF